MRDTDGRPFADGLALEQHVHDESFDAERRIVERKGAGAGRDQSDARRDLRHESADEQEEQQPED